MTVPKTLPAAEAGYSGCTVNGRCFYEGSSKEMECKREVACIHDLEVRQGQERQRKVNMSTEGIKARPPKADEAEAVS